MEMNANTSSTLTDKQYASLGQRFLALIIDFLLLSMVFFPITRIVKGVWIMSSEDHRWDYGWLVTDPLCMVYLIVIVIYFVVLEGVLGATAGKGLMHLRVIRREGGYPGLKRALVRNLLRIVDALPAFNILGVILILLSTEKARFGDRVAGTRVLRLK
ncbi:MAG: RDD family protein [candidate division Zixibacteria bacterium]|nr:RDD family protein [candidate division Zixibacteria bacterium]